MTGFLQKKNHFLSLRNRRIPADYPTRSASSGMESLFVFYTQKAPWTFRHNQNGHEYSHISEVKKFKPYLTLTSLKILCNISSKRHSMYVTLLYVDIFMIIVTFALISDTIILWG